MTFKELLDSVSYDEVERLALERWLAADFGDIHHVHGDIDHIENSQGDRY